MSKRISNIIAVATAPSVEPGTFSTLQLSQQTKVVFSCLNRVQNGIEWWSNLMDKEDTAEFMRKRAIQECNQRAKALNTLIDFLNRAANYSSGMEMEVPHASTTGNIDSYETDEEIEYVTRVMNGNPCAWARSMLIDQKKWPEDWVSPDAPLNPMLWDVEKTYTRYATRYIALTILAELGIYAPPPKADDDTPSDIVMIAACSKELQDLAKCGSKPILLRKIKAMLSRQYAQNPLSVTVYENGDRVTKTYSAVDLIQHLSDAQEMDEADAKAEAKIEADKEAKAQTEGICSAIQSAVRNAVMTATVMKEIATASATMKEAGVGDAVIESMSKSIMDKLTASFS